MRSYELNLNGFFLLKDVNNYWHVNTTIINELYQLDPKDVCSEALLLLRWHNNNKEILDRFGKEPMVREEHRQQILMLADYQQHRMGFWRDRNGYKISGLL
jgi:hypothetical protein